MLMLHNNTSNTKTPSLVFDRRKIVNKSIKRESENDRRRKKVELSEVQKAC